MALIFVKLTPLSPVPFGVELLQLHGTDVLVGLTTRAKSPVPFGVELLQLIHYRDNGYKIVASVTSAFRRGASSAD